jgi:hypothetical protein
METRRDDIINRSALRRHLKCVEQMIKSLIHIAGYYGRYLMRPAEYTPDKKHYILTSWKNAGKILPNSTE